MKQFDETTFENILSSKGVKIAEYVHNADEYENDILLRPLDVNDHKKGMRSRIIFFFILGLNCVEIFLSQKTNVEILNK